MPIQKERPRRPVHVCNLCSAIWEGPVKPPAVCPQCGGGNGWTSGDVGDQPGMVGGRVFIQGTDKPMTRVFVCSACNKTTVVRGSAQDPTACACGAAALAQAMTGKLPAAPPTLHAAAGAAVGNQASRELGQKENPVTYCHHPKGNGICGGLKPCDEHDVPEDRADVRVPEKSDGQTSPVLSPEEYRAEWISERVANWFERHDSVSTGDIPNLWTLTEQLYDEGKKRELLP